jgi:hypothetical protein
MKISARDWMIHVIQRNIARSNNILGLEVFPVGKTDLIQFENELREHSGNMLPHQSNLGF